LLDLQTDYSAIIFSGLWYVLTGSISLLVHLLKINDAVTA